MRKIQDYGLAALILSAVMLHTGCASPKQVQAVRVLHGTLQPIGPKRQGTILVKPLADARKEADRPYVGEIHQPVYPGVLYPAPSGRFIVVKDTVSISTTLTQYLSDALKEAGYIPVVFEPRFIRSETTAKANVLLEGEIKEFWLRPSWTTRHVVQIHLRLLDANGSRLLWEREMRGEHSKFIGAWNVPEFEEVIQNALDKVLNEVRKEFASEQFYLNVKGGL